MDQISPTARALRVLDLLQSRPGITAHDIAQRIGVTERAARRYVAILREADIPVESTSGPYGGYRLGRGLRLPPLVFTATEALGLVMAALDGQHSAADPDEPVGSALGKILRVLPENVGRQAAAMREHAHAVPDRSPARPDPEITSDLVAAVAAQRRLRIGYRGAAGSARTFEVDPWSLVVRFGRWYLLCFAHHAEAIRTFRVDRISEVTVLEETFEVPAGLDPARELEANLSQGWEYETRVVFAAPLREVAPYVRPVMGRLEELGEDQCVLVGSTNNPASYAGEWLAGVPFPFTVEGGVELRTAVADLAERLSRAGSRPPCRAPSRR